MTNRIALAALTLAACTSAYGGDKFADVVQIAPDTYSISRTDHVFGVGNIGKIKTAVFKEAQEFAESLGKVAVARHVQEQPMVLGRNLASIEYTFWVLDKADADARREDLHKEPDQVSDQNIKVEIKQDQPTQKKDLYEQLIKLDDLRKKGILTDAEFEQQKQKLLSQ